MEAVASLAALFLHKKITLNDLIYITKITFVKKNTQKEKECHGFASNLR